jgi:hypothetical protein
MPAIDMHFAGVMQLIRQIERECACAGEETPEILTHHRATLYKAMHDLGGQILTFLDSNPGEEEIRRVKEQVAHSLRAMSQFGPFFHRSFHKLHGYPGDFETIEIIYESEPEGTLCLG